MALTFSGQRLRDAQTQRSMTDQALAQRAGRSISSIYKWRTNRARPGANELAALAEALGCKFEDLYSRVPADGDQAEQAPAPDRVA